jgi:hypothetical protein
MSDRPVEAPQTFELSGHELRYSPPDLLDLSIRGPFTPADSARFLEVVFDTGSQKGPFFLRCDVRGMTEVPSQSRALLSRIERPYPYLGIAFVGASFPMRVIIDTILRAGNLLVPTYFGFPFAFHADWDAAGAWIARVRGERSPV